MESTKTYLDEKSWIIQGNLPTNIDYNFDQLWTLHPPEYGIVKIFDKLIHTPRYTQNYGKSYWYTGMMHNAVELPELFKPFQQWANSLGYENSFNQILINWYANGTHYIGPHSDNEAQIIPSSPIISITLNEGTIERIFRIRSKIDKKIQLDIPMADKTYLVMCGDIQKTFTHEVPKITGKKSDSVGKRINITFRQFK